MKQTAEDRQFARLFAQALRPYVEKELDRGESMGRIGAKLGVTGPGLQKYLDGRTVPSLRTVVRAYVEYKISVRYAGIEVAREAAKKRKKQPANDQLFLPFEITAPGPPERLTLRLRPTGVRKYRLQVTLRAAQ